MTSKTTGGTPARATTSASTGPTPSALNWLPVNYFPISNGSGEFLLWEFPLAFWMEKEGYDVTYISNIDTHADREGLLRAKGWLSVGHDEYWTQQMYDNVCYARDQGVSLAFLSGNSVSGIVYLNPSTDGGPNRVFGRIRRFGRAAAQLMGSSSHGTGMADWTVEKPDHWIFEGTGHEERRRHSEAGRLGIPRPAERRSAGPDDPGDGAHAQSRPRRASQRRRAHLDDLRTAQGQHRLRRRHVLVEHGPLRAARLHESAAPRFLEGRRARATDYQEPVCTHDRQETRLKAQPGHPSSPESICAIMDLCHYPTFIPRFSAGSPQRFGEPTEPQREGWPHIRGGNHTLISAPTGTGKTLAAYLSAIDSLARQGSQLAG